MGTDSEWSGDMELKNWTWPPNTLFMSRTPRVNRKYYVPATRVPAHIVNAVDIQALAPGRPRAKTSVTCSLMHKTWCWTEHKLARDTRREVLLPPARKQPGKRQVDTAALSDRANANSTRTLARILPASESTQNAVMLQPMPISLTTIIQEALQRSRFCGHQFVQCFKPRQRKQENVLLFKCSAY